MNFAKSAGNTPLPNPPPQGGREPARGFSAAAANAEKEQVFTANRASSRIGVAIEASDRASRPIRVREEGSLRVRFPRATDDEVEAVIVNTAGGVAGGDALDIAFSAGAAARAVVTGAAAEKVYRSLGPDAHMRVKLEAADSAELAWLPQETIVFDGARMARSIDVELADDARLILAEAVIFGRTGMGERVERGFVFDRWRVRRDGRLLFADAMRLEGAIDEMLARPACAAGAVAVATVLVVPGDDVLVKSVREQTFCGEVGISAWGGLALARLVGQSGEILRRDLLALLMLLRAGRLPRLWTH